MAAGRHAPRSRRLRLGALISRAPQFRAGAVPVQDRRIQAAGRHRVTHADHSHSVSGEFPPQLVHGFLMCCDDDRVHPERPPIAGGVMHEGDIGSVRVVDDAGDDDVRDLLDPLVVGAP